MTWRVRRSANDRETSAASNDLQGDDGVQHRIVVQEEIQIFKGTLRCGRIQSDGEKPPAKSIYLHGGVRITIVNNSPRSMDERRPQSLLNYVSLRNV